jgi:hypothetical protein
MKGGGGAEFTAGNNTGSGVVILCLIGCYALEVLFQLTSLMYAYVVDHNMYIHF